jgi:phenylacetate-CoA ligase
MKSTLRGRSYWLYDKLKGGKVRKYYDNISKVFKGEIDFKLHQINKLKSILNYASNSTPFYSKFQNKDSIHDFPVVNKNVIRENPELFKSKNIESNNIVSIVTSGSTGTPFEVLQDKDKRTRNTADTIYFGELAGYSLGEKLYYLKIWNDINKKSMILSFMQNIVPVNVFDLSDEFINKLVKKIENNRNTVHLLGYSSAFDNIVKYLDSHNINRLNVDTGSIISMSESLTDYTKDRMGYYFNTQMVSRYSNNENGILAQQLINDNRFLINQASYHMEILHLDKDEQVNDGEIGRIVVTDYYNKAMPMIRYDTGDLGVMTQDNYKNNTALYLEKVKGRKMDQIFNTNGDLISSYVVTNNMWKYKELRQYQFIQLSDTRYKFKLNVSESFNRKDELIAEFLGYLGDNAQIEIEYVDEIPLLSSGKRKKVVNQSND